MKRLFIILTLILFWISGSVYASTWTIQDDYIGGNILAQTYSENWVHADGHNDNYGDVIALSNEIHIFNIDWMTVSITTDGDVTVGIQTGYIDGTRGTTYGDLFVSIDGWSPLGDAGSGYTDDVFGLGESWEYALNTTSRYIYSVDYSVDSNNILVSENIRASNDVMTADAHHYRNDQEVLYNPGSGEADVGTFIFSHEGSLISYAFNLEAFGLSWEDELDLGFHWTMTCANDVIQGGIYKAAVPEPGTMLLLGMGIAGLGAVGRKRIKRR
jgi:hypothetical protein